MLFGGNRITTVTLVLSACLLLGGCVGGDDETSAPTPSAAPSATPTSDATASPTKRAEDEMAAVTVLRAYWSERIRVETSGDFASADFEDVMTADAAEPTLERYRQLQTGNFRRVGRPELRDHRATVDGDTAVASVCVNEDDWGAEADAEIIEPEPAGWYAESHRLERTDGQWVIVGDAETPDGFAC